MTKLSPLCMGASLVMFAFTVWACRPKSVRAYLIAALDSLAVWTIFIMGFAGFITLAERSNELFGLDTHWVQLAGVTLILWAASRVRSAKADRDAPATSA